MAAEVGAVAASGRSAQAGGAGARLARERAETETARTPKRHDAPQRRESRSAVLELAPPMPLPL